MARFKVTFSFVSYIYTPTESYISGDVTPLNFLGILQKLIDVRNELLPQSVGWLSVRVGLHNGTRRSKKLAPGARNPFPGVDAGIIVPAAGRFDDSRNNFNNNITKVSLLMARAFDGDRESRSYLSLVPDLVVRDDEDAYFPANCPEWDNKLKAYRDELRGQQWSVFARKTPPAAPNIPIQAWIQPEAAPGHMAVVVAGAVPAGLVVPYPPVIVRNSKRRGTDRTSYNGTYTVSSVNTTMTPGSTVIFLQGTEAGDPTSVKKNGTLQVKLWDYYPIENVEPIQGTTRKRGNSAAGQRGSSRKSNFLVQ